MSTSTNAITPDLQAKLDKAREEHKNGENLCFSTAQDAIAWMENLIVLRMDSLWMKFRYPLKPIGHLMTNKEY